VRFVYLRIIIV